MKTSEGVSPALFKNLTLVIGVFIVYAAWQGVSNKVDEFKYEPVYGESFSTSGQSEKVDLQSLPIVIARSENVNIDSAILNEQAIEAAFKAREFLVDDEAGGKVKEPEMSVSQKMFLTYRPAVSAITGNGAVINGTFWKVGEKISTMPVILEGGESVSPVLVGVSRNRAIIRVSGEKLTLPFERF